MGEYIIRVDAEDRVFGKIERFEAHRGDGILHRGLSVVVRNSRGEVLLTKRSKERPDLDFPAPFPEFWDVTMAGHPRWGQEDYVTQMGVELREELGIEVRLDEIEYVGKFQYHVADPTYPNTKSGPDFRLSEYEICGVGVVTTDEHPKLNTVELEDSDWVRPRELRAKISSMKMAPWTLIMLERFPGLTEKAHYG